MNYWLRLLGCVLYFFGLSGWEYDKQSVLFALIMIFGFMLAVGL